MNPDRIAIGVDCGASTAATSKEKKKKGKKKEAARAETENWSNFDLQKGRLTLHLRGVVPISVIFRRMQPSPFPLSGSQSELRYTSLPDCQPVSLSKTHFTRLAS